MKIRIESSEAYKIRMYKKKKEAQVKRLETLLFDRKQELNNLEKALERQQLFDEAEFIAEDEE